MSYERKAEHHFGWDGAKGDQIPCSTEADKAQISVAGADDLYKELRIENTLTDADGNEVRLNHRPRLGGSPRYFAVRDRVVSNFFRVAKE
jgi:hypothetical protein